MGGWTKDGQRRATHLFEAAAWYQADIAQPKQYLAGKSQIFRNSERERTDLIEMKLKARPLSHAQKPAAE